ncbi:hypothetical protein GQX74_014628 [Glossina fuscipes]|nr:hypothetical protein GQX74_014628 [Glossina fuscipes]
MNSKLMTYKLYEQEEELNCQIYEQQDDDLNGIKVAYVSHEDYSHKPYQLTSLLRDVLNKHAIFLVAAHLVPIQLWAGLVAIAVLFRAKRFMPCKIGTEVKFAPSEEVQLLLWLKF